jgi:hypothetical protein
MPSGISCSQKEVIISFERRMVDGAKPLGSPNRDIACFCLLLYMNVWASTSKMASDLDLSVCFSLSFRDKRT